VTRPVVTFLSDFGSSDPFVGICHGVIVRTCPDAEVIHLAHGIRPQSVGQGARVLAASIPYLPVGVHMAVVDPGVGSERRAVCLRSADGRLFVGPDNGLLIPAAEACGGIELAVEITETRFMLPAVSRTFHGRDVFSPVCGHLASGADPAELGHAVDPGALVRVAEPGAEVEGSVLTAAVQQIDRFGNLQLSAVLADVEGLFENTATTATSPPAPSRSRTSRAAISWSTRTPSSGCPWRSTAATRPSWSMPTRSTWSRSTSRRHLRCEPRRPPLTPAARSGGMDRTERPSRSGSTVPEAVSLRGVARGAGRLSPAAR
jgi:S-adenosylmethionine hydrolase